MHDARVLIDRLGEVVPLIATISEREEIVGYLKDVAALLGVTLKPTPMLPAFEDDGF